MTIATVPQRGRNRKRLVRHALKLVSPMPPAAVRLPRLEVVERRGPALRPNPLSASGEEVLGLNVTTGCAHQCPFCYARAYPGHPDNDVLYLHAGQGEQVRAELRQRRKLPRAVYLSPSSDPFPPFAEVQAETCRVIEALADEGVAAWVMTRGFIRPRHVEVLVRHAKSVRATVAITTLNHELARVLEPLAAPPRLRLKQLRQLKEQGIHVQAAVDPLIPGMTDARENLAPLVDALAEAGVEQITAGYLFLRPAIRQNLIKDLGPFGWAEPILERYESGPLLAMGNTARATHLPRAERQRGYALLMALAAARGLEVTLSRVTNPDFRTPEPRVERRPMRQLTFPYN